MHGNKNQTKPSTKGNTATIALRATQPKQKQTQTTHQTEHIKCRGVIRPSRATGIAPCVEMPPRFPCRTPLQETLTPPPPWRPSWRSRPKPCTKKNKTTPKHRKRGGEWGHKTKQTNKPNKKENKRNNHQNHENKCKQANQEKAYQVQAKKQPNNKEYT